jgi:hypothetical protein
MDLICPCIGINLFTSHSTSPAATIVIITVVSGIACSPILVPGCDLVLVLRHDRFLAMSSLSGEIRKRRRITPLRFYSFKLPVK